MSVCLGVAVAAVCELGVCAPALAQTFVPAHLVALAGEPPCPSNVRESPILTCQVVVDERGDANDDDATHCFGKLGGDDSRRAYEVRQDLLRSRFTAASIDGEAVKVYASFRLLFQEIGGRCDVTVYPNLGNAQNELAENYVAPQEIFTDGGWMAEAKDSLRYEWRHVGMAFVMSVAVDELGNASDGRIEVNNYAFEKTVDLAVEALERQRFIPAFVDGTARPARYFEFIYTHEPARRRLR